MTAHATSTFPAIRADSRPLGAHSGSKPAGALRAGRLVVRGNPDDDAQAMYSPVNAACSRATISLSSGIRGLVRRVGSA